MTHIITEISKYLMIILFACYTFEGFFALSFKKTEKMNRILNRQLIYLFMIHVNGSLLIIMNESDIKHILLCLAQTALLVFIQIIYHFVYAKASRLIANHICMLLAISFIMLTRLNYKSSVKQLIFAAVAAVSTFLVPMVIKKLSFLKRLKYLYAFIGIAALAVVALAGNKSYGANLSITVGSINMQFSELIKIVFVFFVASMYAESANFKQVVITSVIAAIHVLILVASTDLGSALIYFVTYIIMVYAASGKVIYVGLGLGGGAGAAVLGYKLFSHVRVRVKAFLDPLSVIDDAGYQVSQSLFAIGTAGYFGMGLYQGSPLTIPVVTKDFIFSAIAEELGGIFAILLILLYAGVYLLFLNIAMQLKDMFDKLIARGLGTTVATQVFLAVGGGLNALPSTGVTLPLVSYGGSSLVCTFLCFSVIQGLYLKQHSAAGAVDIREIYDDPDMGTNEYYEQDQMDEIYSLDEEYIEDEEDEDYDEFENMEITLEGEETEDEEGED
ncbi:MAG: FtsW/RodA/SpoVE family cell cycle protein [Lachnospiraceae bacterium]|nr:FtsW/RodA/SpoVE family cell cycle protein [Lachnospiraceae bacterium]